MKHSDINHSDNTFGIHLNTKSFSINNPNSNAIMIGSVISTQINPSSSAILSTALSTSRPNAAVITKPIAISNMVGQWPGNNSIKFVNLSKCQQLSNFGKDSPNMTANNAINVQFVTPILNNSSTVLNNCTGLSKVDNVAGGVTSSLLLTSASNQTSNNSITCTKLILQSSQAPMLPHGTVTIIPQLSDGSGGPHLIKNARYTLTGGKQTPQALRPITACTASSVHQSSLSKQSISKISPTKTVNNYTINVSEANSTVTKSVPIKPIICSITPSNNIRVALAATVTNSKVNTNASKIQLISPKSSKRSGSPISATGQDGRAKAPLTVNKDENIENPSGYNSQSGSYSPARKRARKQHLKAVTNKSQKLGTNNKFDPCSVINSIRHALNEKSLVSAPVSIAPTTTKCASITTQNKVEDTTNPCSVSVLPNSTNSNNNPQIIIPIKNPIHICTSKVYTSHLATNNSILNTNNSFNQVQILAQTSFPRPLQLSPISCHNLILTPTFTKSVTNISPQKVIHIGQSKPSNNHLQSPKVEKVPTTDIPNNNNNNTVLKDGIINPEMERIKVEPLELKTESCEISTVKFSLFPQKYHWNARRTHYEKECDVKIKKSKTQSSIKQSNSENPDGNMSTNDIEIHDTSWRLYKASSQFLMQQCFDEENLRNFHKLKEKFDLKPQTKHNDDNDEPIFRKVCLLQHRYEQLPDQLDDNCFSEFTDPRLFGISDDIIDNHINTITTTNEESQQCREKLPLHHCSESCIIYLSEEPALTQPPQILRILDLIEGLIVKEKKIIEKESEINDQCLRLLQNTDYVPINLNRTHSNTERFNGHRW